MVLAIHILQIVFSPKIFSSTYIEIDLILLHGRIEFHCVPFVQAGPCWWTFRRFLLPQIAVVNTLTCV